MVEDSFRIAGEASAPAKLIFSGEHAVVYGHPVLAIAINKRVRATFEITQHDAAGINLNIVNASRDTEIEWTFASEITSI